MYLQEPLGGSAHVAHAGTVKDSVFLTLHHSVTWES